MYRCTALQVNHAMMSHGIELVTKINSDLKKFLDEKLYSNISELKSKALPHLLPTSRFYDVYGKTKDVIVVSWLLGDIQCGICEKSCPGYAITVGSEEPIVNKDIFEGCGLYVANCPVEAVRLKNEYVIYTI